jgi:hypothetical protein
MTQRTYQYEDLFSDDPDNPDNLLLTFPPEILEENGWDAGDLLKFTVDEETRTLTIIKVGEKDDDNNS